MKARKPNLNRCSTIKRRLEQGQFDFGEVTWVDTRELVVSDNIYNVADLFSGSGGLMLGFALAGYQPLFGVESDPFSSTTFRYNFPKAVHFEGKIQLMNLDIIEKLTLNKPLHVLIAGFPCPGFSVAGFRKADDMRNQLYKYILPFVDRFKPLFVMFENVPGFVTLDKGRFLDRLIKDFSLHGYNIAAQILEAANYGVPQLRPRTIMVGNRLGLPNPYPQPLLSEENYTSIETAINDLRELQPNPKINHEWTKHSDKMTQRIAQVPPGGSLYSSYMDAWKRQYTGVPSMTVKENHGGTHIHPELNRVLSARELARLQTFPDTFLFEGTMKRAYFQIGNAVPALLAKYAALAIRSSLDTIIKEKGAGSIQL